MHRRTLRAALWIVALQAALAAAADQPYQETVDRSFSVSPTVRVGLDNVNGDVSIDVWDRDEVRVQAVKRASTAELLAELDVRFDASDERVEVDTRYPSGHHRGESSSVEYTLTVPRQARIDDVDLVNGDLRIIGVEGGVAADCVNGRIHAENLAGEIELDTVNGAVEVDASTLADGDDVTLESVNGRIDLTLPASADASVRAETVNGSIDNDLGLEVRKGRYIGSSMKGTLGSGGAEVSLSTVNGPISVSRR